MDWGPSSIRDSSPDEDINVEGCSLQTPTCPLICALDPTILLMQMYSHQENNWILGKFMKGDGMD
jgi:hypothetical protein